VKFIFNCTTPANMLQIVNSYIFFGSCKTVNTTKTFIAPRLLAVLYTQAETKHQNDRELLSLLFQSNGGKRQKSYSKD
jgi:hypothetical protein